MALLDSANNLAELENIPASRVNLEVYSWSEVYPIGQTYNRAEINAKIASGSDAVRKYFKTSAVDALAWYTLGTITLSDGTYSSLNFLIQINKGNLYSWGNSNKFDSYQFLVKLTRSGTTQDDGHNIEIIGPKAGMLRGRIYDNKYFELQFSADEVGEASYGYSMNYLAGSDLDWSTAAWLEPMDKVPGVSAPGMLFDATTTKTLGVVTHLQSITQNGNLVVDESKPRTYGSGLTGSSTLAGTQNIEFSFPTMPSYTGTSDDDLLPVYNSTTGAYQKITKGDLIPDAAGLRIKGSVELNTGNTGVVSDDPLNTLITEGVAPNTAGSADPARGYSFFVTNDTPVISLITGTAEQFELSDQVFWTGSAWRRLPAFGGTNVRTFNNRAGDVVPVVGDYTASTVNGASAGGVTSLTIQQALDYKPDSNQVETISGAWTFDPLVTVRNGISSTNPDNTSAATTLTWLSNIPRLRVSGTTENFEILGIGDANRLSIGTSESYIGAAKYKIWHAGNSNLGTVDWSAKDLNVSNNIFIQNNKFMYGKDSANLSKTLIGIDSTNKTVVGNNSNQLALYTLNNDPLVSNGAVSYTILHDGNIGNKNYAVKSLNETITGLWTHSEGINMSNNKAIQGTANGAKLTAGTKYNLVKLDNDDDILVGADTARMGFFSNDPANLWLVSEIGNPARQYRMYNEGFKPTPAAIGAVNKAGDTMTGPLVMALNSRLDGHNHVQRYGGTPSSYTHYYDNLTSGTTEHNLRFARGDGNFTAYNFNGSGAIHSDTEGRFYSQGFRPTPLEIGAVPTGGPRGTAAAAYYLPVDSASITGTKFRLPFGTNSNKMVCFTVRAYQGYNAFDVQFSGYLYETINQWYLPKARMIAGTAPILATMGRDDDGRAYVWLSGASYRGAAVLDVVGAYREADWNTGWEIVETDSTPNMAFNQWVQPNSIEGHTHNVSDLGAVAKSGDTMTGELIISRPAGNRSLSMQTPGSWSYLELKSGSTVAHIAQNSESVEGATAGSLHLRPLGIAQGGLTLQPNEAMLHQTSYGRVTIGAQNAGHCHYTTDRSNHWFNTEVRVQGEIMAGPAYNQRVYHQGFKPTAAEVGAHIVQPWITSPGIDANNLAYANSSGFTYANNAPHSGPFASFSSANGAYCLQLNANYGNGTQLAFRTHNGDTNNWNTWYNVYHQGSKPTWHDTGFSNRSYWKGAPASNLGPDAAIVSQLGWNNYGNGHTIFDASAGLSPNSTAVNRDNAEIGWTSSYPTLMGWNGANTFGLRVDSARWADGASNSYELNGTWKTAGQDLTVHGKRAMVSLAGENLLVLNYGNDFGSGVSTHGSFKATGAIGCGSTVRGTTLGPTYTLCGLETYVEPTSGDIPKISFHKGGHYAGMIDMRDSNTFAFVTGDAGSFCNLMALNITGQEIYANGWFRARGNQGIHFENWGGGLYMEDSVWVRVYGGKKFYVPYQSYDSIQVGGGIQLCDGAVGLTGNSIVGAYDASRFQGIFAMGPAYRLPSDGIGTANHYGISWTHSNNPSVQGQRIFGHHMVVQAAGITKVALGDGGIWSLGTITSADNISAYSDERVKANIKTIPDALSKVMKIRGVTYTRTDQEDKAKLHTGVLAQEVEKVLPEAVSTSVNGDIEDFKSVAYGNLVGLLIEAIKELKQEVEELKNGTTK